MAQDFRHVPDYAGFLVGRRKDIRRQLKDYAEVGRALLWQRQLMIGGIALLVAFYYDAWIALISFALVEITEFLDWRVFKKILNMSKISRQQLTRIILTLHVDTALSAGAIGLFAVSIAQLQGHNTHFMPLFVLFAAALFSAMHNHQIPQILVLRLSIYGATFIFIPIRDLWLEKPPISSELWLQLFVGLFVLYFIFDTARAHARLYREGLKTFEALKVEAQRARMASMAKSDFISVVSHELRTPLTSIRGSLDLIGAEVFGSLPAPMIRPFTIARNNSHRLSELINDLLDFQKIEAGKMEYEYEVVEVRDLVMTVTDEIRPMAQSRRVSIGAVVQGPSAAVFGDGKRLAQVLVNLLSNAIKFSMDAGHVQIKTETLSDRVRISVSDNGVGLPTGAEEKLFQPFYQADSGATRKVNGTGLGLSISKQIVEAHGGSIDFLRHDNQGTTFFVELDRCFEDPV